MRVTVGELAAALGAEAAGDTGYVIRRPAAPGDAEPGDLVLAMEPRYARALAGCRAGAALLWPGADWQALGFRAAIFAPRPRLALAGVTRTFAAARSPGPGLHPLAVVGPGAEVGAGAAVGPFVSIGAGARIGPRARIFAHVSVGEGAVIGADALLLEGVRIGPGVVIGDRFIAQPNAVIGADGFSFVTAERGAAEAARAGEALPAAGGPHLRIDSIGSVRIGDDVEIGAGSCIDRGTVADTRIGSGTKIDNLVQVGHNVTVGAGCLLCGQVGLAGSVDIGDGVVLGGKVGVGDHLRIGAGAVVAGGALVATHVPARSVVMGAPAIARAKAQEIVLLTRRLPDLVARLEALEKRVSISGPNG